MTRVHNLKHTPPSHMARLAAALRDMGYVPDFGFQHNFAQATRIMWNQFTPKVGDGAGCKLLDVYECIKTWSCPCTMGHVAVRS